MGSWSLQGPSEIALSDLSVKVTPIGCGVPPVELKSSSLGLFDDVVVVPRRFTLQLSSKRRESKASALRSSLLPFCRLEAGAIQVIYVGVNRTVELTAYYLGGLEDLELQFIAPEPRWSSATQTGTFSGTITLVGTASTKPTIILTGGSGTVTAITVTNGAKTAQLLLNQTIASGETVTINLSARTVVSSVSGALSGALLVGSQVDTFALWPGDNTVTVTKTGTITATYSYGAYYWSYEDADV